MTAPSPLASSAARRFPFAKFLAVGYILVVLIVLGAEIAARVDDHERRGIGWLEAPDYQRDLFLQDSFGVRGRPGGHFQKWHLNSAGFRSPESNLTSVPYCRRVMVLGASETFGYQEAEGFEYPAQLSDSLKGAGCFQVLNAGVVGLNTAGIIQFWSLWAARFRPDIVVVLPNPLLYLGDRPPTPPARPQVPVYDRGPWWTPRLIGRLKEFIHYPSVIQQRRVQRMVDALAVGHDSSWYFRGAPADRLEAYRADLETLLDSVISSGAQPVVLSHPMRYVSIADGDAAIELEGMRQFGARARIDVIASMDSAGYVLTRGIARRRSIPFADARLVMTGQHELFVDPVHFSERGAAVLAGVVARAIRVTETYQRP